MTTRPGSNPTPTSDPDGAGELFAALELSQHLGMLGGRPVPEVVAHARAFVAALASLPAGSLVVDLGTGGGVPGLVIAWDRPDLEVALIDRRATRIDHVRRLIARLGLTEATAYAASADAMADRLRRRAAAVVSRGFGTPAAVLSAATPLLTRDGVVIVSEPPTPDPSRWPDDLLERSQFSRRPWPDRRLAILQRDP